MNEQTNASEQHKFDCEFYEAIGRALTEWAGIEDRLSWLFGSCVDYRAGDENGASASAGLSTAIFFSIDGLQARLKMIDNVMTATLEYEYAMDAEQIEIGKGLAARWISIRKQFKDLSERRNRLAHWSVYVTADSAGKRKPILIRTLSDPRNIKILRDESFEFDERYVMECASLFSAAREAIQKLATDITFSALPLQGHLYRLAALAKMADMDLSHIYETISEFHRSY
jgi:hypothetical protein